MKNKQNKAEHKFGTVTLIGRPNAGKSTLLNYLIGEKIAIVTDKPQTTRTRIMGIINGPQWQMVVLDTPGVHKPKDRLGKNMVDTALGALDACDLIYYLVDAAGEFGPGEAYLIQQLKKTGKPVFLLLNKVDLLPKEDLLKIIMDYNQKMEFREIFPISALKGDNVENLLKTTVDYFQPGPPAYDEDEMTDQPERVIVSEMIREKAILATRQEVPYAVACVVERMEERSDTLMDIDASLIVERDSQKGILIGKGGQTLKWIGSEARKDIEHLLDIQVNLKLWVKVKADWRNQPRQLKDLGLNPQR
ncbi:MAG: GTPase Era [Peptococcaceae bacterium]|nr:GTPase Era [Peptococcaceae bacterium]